MLDYVVEHRPPIVILENVSNAPWDEVVTKFEGIGYEAAYMRLDTK
jgi:site-specific DNA-cytosine methylase